MKRLSCFFFYLLLFSTSSIGQAVTVIKGVTLIDGTGSSAKQNVNLVIKEDKIDAILPANAALPANAETSNLSGKFIIPALINGHCHLGLLKGDNSSPNNYTRENILRHLEKYEQ